MLMCCCAAVLLCRRIAQAIAEAGLTGQAHPTDYLQFFCLGKREAAEPVSTELLMWLSIFVPWP
jgi:hypothetical protein